jgi:hypothetical protein
MIKSIDSPGILARRSNASPWTAMALPDDSMPDRSSAMVSLESSVELSAIRSRRPPRIRLECEEALF